MEKDYNLVQDAETGFWTGRLVINLGESDMHFPASSETLDGVITIIEDNVCEAGLGETC